MAVSNLSHLQQLQSASYIGCVVTCLIVYEHTISFAQEIRVIWCRKFTGATILFLMNRYTTLMSAFLVMVTLFPIDHIELVMTDSSILEVRPPVSVQIRVVDRIDDNTAFSVLRTYAIAGRNRLLWAAPVFILTFIPIPIIIEYVIIPVSLGRKDVDTIAAELAYRISLVVANLVMLVLVIRRTFYLYYQTRRSCINTPIIKTLLQDGAIFFALLGVEHAYSTLHILSTLTLLSEFLAKLSAISPIGSVLQEMIPILTSRFLLNLRQASSADAAILTPSRLSINVTTAKFCVSPSVIGNLGEPFEDQGDEEGFADDV
ncbi:hypothetical protein BC835DRAFT_1309389 [Cytidiella melzeri]|nr:hypothetical protein BC835DRAFT_1309389 [Cytidiella melzeri]